MKTWKTFANFLFSFLALAAALPTFSHAMDPLLSSAAEELKTQLAPFTVPLASDTVLFHWTNHISLPSELSKYLNDVPLDFGNTTWHTDDWVGPGLYLALDPLTSFSFGNTLVELTIAKGTSLVYANAPGAMPLKISSDSKIRQWLIQAGKLAGKAPDFSQKIGPDWLSEAAGGGDLIRATGISGFIYNWNLTAALDGCDHGTTAAVNLIDSSVIAKSKMILGDTLWNTSRAQFEQQGDPDLVFLKILSFEADPNRDEHWHDSLPADRLDTYTRWKMEHVMLCQKPYLSQRFPTSNQ
jgi:hypothetical protein